MRSALALAFALLSCVSPPHTSLYSLSIFAFYSRVGVECATDTIASRCDAKISKNPSASSSPRHPPNPLSP